MLIHLYENISGSVLVAQITVMKYDYENYQPYWKPNVIYLKVNFTVFLVLIGLITKRMNGWGRNDRTCVPSSLHLMSFHNVLELWFYFASFEFNGSK